MRSSYMGLVERAQFELPSGRMCALVEYDEPATIAAAYDGIDLAGVEEEDVVMCIRIYASGAALDSGAEPSSRVLLRNDSRSVLARGSEYTVLRHTHTATETWEEALRALRPMLEPQEDQGSGIRSARGLTLGPTAAWSEPKRVPESGLDEVGAFLDDERERSARFSVLVLVLVIAMAVLSLFPW